VKDTFEVAGVRTTAGAPELAGHVPDHDADVVARLRDAGAVILGKTNVPLYAMDVQTYNDVFGVTNNPWDHSRVPGGSSGGAAAAVAAGLSALEVGSDIGGSIRNPAHFCGVVGHKPTHGVVSQLGHIPGPPGTRSSADLGVMGPLGRTVADVALALDVVAGPPADQAAGWHLDLPAPRATSLANLRLAAVVDDPATPVSGDVRRVLGGALDAFEASGAHIDRQPRLPFDLGELFDLYFSLLMAGTSAGVPRAQYARFVELASDPAADRTDLVVRAATGYTMRHTDWLRANERRHRLRHAMAGFFERYDALLLPAMAVPAFPHDHRERSARTLEVDGEPRPYLDTATYWAALASLLLLPATVVPAGLAPGGPAGLPVGLQIVGPYLEDRTALAVAALAERVLGRLGPPPGC
jgi:amidase